MKNYKDLRYQRSLSMEVIRHSGRNTPLHDLQKKVCQLHFQDAPSSIEDIVDNIHPEEIHAEKDLSGEFKAVTTELASHRESVVSVMKIMGGNEVAFKDELKSPNLIEVQEIPELEGQSVVEDIINSTPELKSKSETCDLSTRTACLEAEQEGKARNNDSFFAEVYGTSPECISYVDEGADLQVSGVGTPVDALMMENSQLREAVSEMDMARKNLIARVEELTAEREALQRENENTTQSLSWCESKLRETEQDLQRIQVEMEEARKQSREDAEVDIPAAQRKRFTRAEMARVLMERNQYKEKLIELQDAVRRTEMLRASKEVQAVEMKKSSFWKVFDRLFSPSNGPQEKVKSVNTPLNIPTLNRGRSVTFSSVDTPSQANSYVRRHFANFPSSSDAEDCDRVPLRGKKHELYRQIRSHIWKTHGRAQLHGWSNPSTMGNKASKLL
ncbi:C-Jun-amino-terminal kinase-interacting protein 4-like [Pelobates fuscus]|uniref:C-Jun-amino-terminal kinase-interacting protein 4-like n=1 Tax=Pelobates fuscus TaxID=191477 RepID=UPI002FE46562